MTVSPPPGPTPGLGRRCTRTACGRAAVATLTYNYGDQTAVLGPLATYAEPHAYDLCDQHSERLSAPRGWDVVRLTTEPVAYAPSTDDLAALADLVREAGRPSRPPAPVQEPEGVRESGRRGHLRVLRPVPDGPASPDAGPGSDPGLF